MKILQIISGRNVNGAVTYCKFISEQLVSFGHDVTILCRPGGWLQKHVDPSIPLVESEQNRSLFELQRMAKWIRENGIDLIHTHMTRGHAFGVLMRMMTGVPVVATAHNCSFQLHWRLNNYVIANSQSTYQYHRRVNRVSDRRMQKVFCFTSLARFKQVTDCDVKLARQQMKLDGSEFVVGVVGDVCARKGQNYLFRALPEIIEAIPNFKLILLGSFRRKDPFVKKLRAFQMDHPLMGRVKWMGSRSNVQDFMTAFDLCVVPSIEEPLGLVALEALAAGTPVVASQTGGLPEIVRPGENGTLVPPKDPAKLAQAIIEMARCTDGRKRLGENGRKMVNREFDPVLLSREVESVFMQVVDRRRAA